MESRREIRGVKRICERGGTGRFETRIWQLVTLVVLFRLPCVQAWKPFCGSHRVGSLIDHLLGLQDGGDRLVRLHCDRLENEPSARYPAAAAPGEPPSQYCGYHYCRKRRLLCSYPIAPLQARPDPPLKLVLQEDFQRNPPVCSFIDGFYEELKLKNSSNETGRTQVFKHTQTSARPSSGRWSASPRPRRRKAACSTGLPVKTTLTVPRRAISRS
jgi:hypothetical protein